MEYCIKTQNGKHELLGDTYKLVLILEVGLLYDHSASISCTRRHRLELVKIRGRRRSLRKDKRSFTGVCKGEGAKTIAQSVTVLCMWQKDTKVGSCMTEHHRAAWDVEERPMVGQQPPATFKRCLSPTGPEYLLSVTKSVCCLLWG